MRVKWVMTRLNSLLLEEVRVGNVDGRLEEKDGGTS